MNPTKTIPESTGQKTTSSTVDGHRIPVPEEDPGLDETDLSAKSAPSFTDLVDQNANGVVAL